MELSKLLFVLNFASFAIAHGYVKWIGVDNKLYESFPKIQNGREMY
jgi:hypothetical protein